MVTVTADKVIVELDARMAQYNADVRGSARNFEDSQRRTRAAIAQTEQHIKRSTESIRVALRSTASVLAAGIGIAAIGRMADSYTRFTNQLRIAGLEGDNLTRVQNALFGQAQRYGVELESLGQLYGRLSQGARELGANQGQLLQFTNGVAAAIKIQGGDATAARGALLQLSQALGGQIVRAEEFNSINEGARPILQAVANGIDRYRGSVSRLRVDVINGRVTSQEFFAGFLRGSQGLEAQAARSNFTIGQSFTILNNALGQYIGRTNESLSATARISQAIIYLADDINEVASAIAVIAVAYGGRYVAALSAATLASARKAVIDGTLAAAEGRLAAASGVVTTALLREDAAMVTTTAAAGRLSGSLAVVTGAEIAAASAAARAGTIMGATGVIASRLGAGLLAAFGGPVGLAITVVTLALIYFATRTGEATLDVNKFKREGEDLNANLAQMGVYARGAALAIGQAGAAASAATGQMQAFAGATGEAAQRLYNLARARQFESFRSLALNEIQARMERQSAEGRISARAQSGSSSARFGFLPNPADEALDRVDLAVIAVQRSRERVAQDAQRAAIRIPLPNYLLGSESEGRDVPGELARVTRDLTIARERGLRTQIDTLEAQQFELRQYQRYRGLTGGPTNPYTAPDAALSPQAAAEQSARDKAEFEAASRGAQGDRDARAGAAAARAAARRAAAAERDAAADAARYAGLERRANNEISEARAELSGSAEARAQIEIDRLEDERISRNEELRQQQRQGQLGGGAEGRTRLLELQSLNDQRAELQKQIVRDREQERIRAEQQEIDVANLTNAQDLERATGELAESREAQRASALRLLDLAEQEERLGLEGVLASKDATDAQRAIALARLDILGQLQEARRAGVNRQYESPIAAYIRANTRTTDQLNDDFQRVAVSGLDNLNSGITDAITGAKSLGEAFHDIANQIIADLVRIAVQQAIMAGLNAIMGGAGGAPGGSGGGIGSFFSQLFSAAPGRAAGGHVIGGKVYSVGERGIELFKPSQSGQIVPNNRVTTTLGGGSGGGYGDTIMNVNVVAPGANAQTVELIRQTLSDSAPTLIAAAQRATIQTLGRRRMT